MVGSPCSAPSAAHGPTVQTVETRPAPGNGGSREALTVRLATSGDDSGVGVQAFRRFGVSRLRSWGLHALVDDVELVLSELATNTLKYGAGRDITCCLSIRSNVLLVEVTDGSRAQPLVREVSLDEEGGRGMFIVQQLADDWGVSGDGTSVWCTFGTG
ncbi:ATP-binding protein [Streptomyces sp. NBC_01190]|uniref:ATP-binding protein n=1 Tax=Streptomyces sp. NBC_01190 TaxID=2903767 RepID=UPI00386A40F1